MNTVLLHGEQAPSATFTQTAVDGSHNLAAQFSLAYDDLRSTSFADFRFANVAVGTNAFVHDAVGQLRVFGMSSTLSFSSQFLERLNNVFQVVLSATLGSVGQLIKQAQKRLPELTVISSARSGLNFRSDIQVNPSAVGTTQMFMSSLLNFVAASPKRSIPRTASVLNFIGTFVRPHNKILTAALSFVGLVKKSTLNPLSGILSFIGSISNRPPHVIAQPLLQGSLSFSGAVTKRTARTLMPATLFFSTVKFPKSFPRIVPAVLSFVGFSSPVFHLFTSSLTAVLSFIGFIARIRGKVFKATASFVGTFKKSTGHVIPGSLSFIGIFTRLHPLAAVFTAALSFVGAFTRARKKLLTAALSFIGNLNTVVGGFVVKSLTATLSFSGSLSTSMAVVYQQLLESVLSFVGLLSDGYADMWTDIFVRVNSVIQKVSSGFKTLTKKARFASFDASVSSTPLETLSFVEGSEIWVKNLSETDSVQVDSSSDFDKFPQTIPPRNGVFLLPVTPGSLFSKSDSPGVIQVIGTKIVSTIPPPPPFIWYVQFQVKFNSSEIAGGGGSADIFDAFSDHEATDDGWQMAIFPNFGTNKMWFYSNDGITQVDLTFTPGTWYDIGMIIDTGPDPTLFTFTPRVNGVDYDMFTAPVTPVRSITFGGRYGFGSPINRNMDNLLIGSTAWGSSDVFSADFTSTIVPPFVSIVGSGMSVSGGTMLVNNPTADVYALKAFS